MKHIRPPKNFIRDDQDSDYWKSHRNSIVIDWKLCGDKVYLFTDWVGWELYDEKEYYRMKVILECL